MLGLGVTAAWGQNQASSRYEVVTVQPGDTVWGIAAGRYPSGDIRARVQEIERANGLSDPRLLPGQRLRIPSGG